MPHTKSLDGECTALLAARRSSSEFARPRVVARAIVSNDCNPATAGIAHGVHRALGSGIIEVQRTRSDPSRLDSESANPATYQNVNTHWWDGSQLYGSSLEKNNEIRSFVDGKLKLENGALPTDSSGVSVTGFNNNWWVGLSMLHQAFTLEHGF